MFITQDSASPSERRSPSVESEISWPATLKSASLGSLMASDVNMQVEAGFWSVYLPHEDPMLDGSIDGVRAAPWLPTVRALAEEYSNVRVTVRAVAYAGLGWMREDQSLVQHGLRLYAQALRETNDMLQNPAHALSDAVLAAWRTLSLFEMFRRGPGAPETGQTQATDWRSHAEGTFRLVQLRGPERHISEHGLNLYDGVRMTGVIHGIASRRSNGFTGLSWTLPGPKSLRDKLFDSMNALPQMFQQLDEFSARCDQDSANRDQDGMIYHGKDLLEQCLAVCEFLYTWEMQALKFCYDKSICSESSLQAETMGTLQGSWNLADVCLSHGFGFFFLCAQYWSICVKAYSAVVVLQRQITALVENLELDIMLPEVASWIDPEPAAHHIANTASHFFHPEAGLWSAQSAIFPVGTALLYFARSGRHNSEMVDRMNAAFSDNKPGAIMRDFLQSTGMYSKRDSKPSP